MSLLELPVLSSHASLTENKDNRGQASVVIWCNGNNNNNDDIYTDDADSDHSLRVCRPKILHTLFHLMPSSAYYSHCTSTTLKLDQQRGWPRRLWPGSSRARALILPAGLQNCDFKPQHPRSSCLLAHPLPPLRRWAPGGEGLGGQEGCGSSCSQGGFGLTVGRTQVGQPGSGGPRTGSQPSASWMGGLCRVGQVLETGGRASVSWCHPSASWSFPSLGKTGALHGVVVGSE